MSWLSVMTGLQDLGMAVDTRTNAILNPSENKYEITLAQVQAVFSS